MSLLDIAEAANDLAELVAPSRQGGRMSGEELFRLCGDDLQTCYCTCGHNASCHYDAPYGSGDCRVAGCGCNSFRKCFHRMDRAQQWLHWLIKQVL